MRLRRQFEIQRLPGYTFPNLHKPGSIIVIAVYPFARKEYFNEDQIDVLIRTMITSAWLCEIEGGKSKESFWHEMLSAAKEKKNNFVNKDSKHVCEHESS